MNNNEVNREENETVFTDSVEDVNSPVEEVEPSSSENANDMLAENKFDVYDDECMYKPNIPLIVCLTLLSVCAVIGGFYLYINSKPSMVFKKVINSAFLKVENAFDAKDNNYASIKSNIKYDFNFKSNDETLQSFLDVINKVKFEYDLGIDYEDEVISFNMTGDYDKKEMFDVTALAKEDKVYVDLKNVFLNPYYLQLDEKISLKKNDSSVKDVKEAIAGIRVAMNAAIKDEYIVKEKENNLDKYILTIDDNNVKSISLDFVKSLRYNDKFINAVANLSEEDKDSVTENLDEVIKELEDWEVEDAKGLVKVVLYVKGNNVKQIDVQVTDDDEESITLSLKLVDEDNMTFSAVYGKEKVTGSVMTKQNNVNSIDYTFKFSYSSGEEEVISATINASSETVYNDVFKDTISKNATSFEDLTSDETEIIMEKLQENEALVNFIEDISEIALPFIGLGSSETDCDDDTGCGYGYDYDYDYDVDFDYDYDL